MPLSNLISTVSLHSCDTCTASRVCSFTKYFVTRMPADLISPLPPVQVFVILFGVGTSDTEGIYSLRALSGDDGLPQDTIIAFECEDDAVR